MKKYNYIAHLKLSLTISAVIYLIAAFVMCDIALITKIGTYHICARAITALSYLFIQALIFMHVEDNLNK